MHDKLHFQMLFMIKKLALLFELVFVYIYVKGKAALF